MNVPLFWRKSFTERPLWFLVAVRSSRHFQIISKVECLPLPGDKSWCHQQFTYSSSTYSIVSCSSDDKDPQAVSTFAFISSAFAVPVTVIGIISWLWESEKYSANLAMSTPLLWQYCAAFLHASWIWGWAGIHGWGPLGVRSPMPKGEALMTPTPFSWTW